MSEQLLTDALAFWRSTLLLAAHELGLFAELARGPLQAQCLAGRLGLREEATGDFLDALVAHGFLEVTEGVYRNTPPTDRFLDPEKPHYVGRWLDMARAAQLEVRDLPGQLRDPNTGTHARTLSERMWADIAAILRASDARDEQ